MKKISKRILMSLFTIALMFTFGLNVNAAPNSITIKEADYTRDFINADSNIGMTMFTTTDGVVVYCMDIDKKPLIQGQSASLSSDADAGVQYILENGYPKKTYRNNKGMDAYITQMALWWYLSEDKLSSEFKNATGTADKYSLVSATKKLVADAKAAKKSEDKPTINVVANNTNMKVSADGKYYESDLITANLTGAKTFTISLTGATNGTQVVDEQGNVGTAMNSGEKFKIRVPVNEVNKSLNIIIKFKATGTISKAKIYKPVDNSYQRVVGLFTENVVLNQSITLKLSRHICEVDDGKYYDPTGKEVDKATYDKECQKSCTTENGKYYGKDGKETNKETYTKQCLHVCEYTDNKYYGKDGKVVDKAQYDKECNNSCAIIDNKYYGKDGKAVNKETFNKECKNICQNKNGVYYGINGNKVDKDTFDRQCGQEINVPNTSANIVFWSIGIGILAIAAGIGIIAYRNHKKHVKKA